ncbi:MAG: methionine adenosyltransferase [Gammaproteobacteria bacterium]
MHGHKFFASESVSGGHPDKVADQISDAILDSCLRAAGVTGGARDPQVRMACETLVKTDLVVVAGEFRLPDGLAIPDFEANAREAVADAGYKDGRVPGFDAATFSFQNHLSQQSDEIYQGTNQERLGAGDQGMMFGYAVEEAADLMPLPIQASNAILRLHDKYRHLASDPIGSEFLPDAKSQVTVEYDSDNKPVRIVQAIFSTQHTDKLDLQQVRSRGHDLVMEALASLNIELATDIEVVINSAGTFVSGGPAADCGLTGRKIMVDTYGSLGRHGGGAFSGKDPTKVDRSAAYACRYVAKNIVSSGLASECEIQVSYAIGKPEPSFSINTFGTGRLPDTQIANLVSEVFDLTPQGIIESLSLWQPFYRRFCVLGHFGNQDAPWEQTDRAEQLRKLAL